MSGCMAQGSWGQRRRWANEASCSRKEKASRASEGARCCHCGRNSTAPPVTNNPADGGAPTPPENRSLPGMNGNEAQRTHLHCCPQEMQTCVYVWRVPTASPTSTAPQRHPGPQTSSQTASHPTARQYTPVGSYMHTHTHTHTRVHPNLSPPFCQIWGPPAPKLTKSSITRRCLAKGRDPWISPHSSGGVSNHPHQHQGPVVPMLTLADVYIPGLFVL